MPSERLLSQTAGRRVLLQMDAAGAVRVVRRIRADSEAGPDLVARATALALIKGLDLGCLAKVHEISITAKELVVSEQYIDGFTLGSAVDVVREQISVNVALSIVFELAVSLSRLHALKEKDGRPARLIHGKLGLDRVLITTQGETKLAGLEGLRGDPVTDVDALLRAMQSLLLTRAKNPQGKALLDQLGKLRFPTMSDLAKAIQVYLARQDPGELVARRARFTSTVLLEVQRRAESGGSSPEPSESFEPSSLDGTSELSDSTQLVNRPVRLDPDTTETAAASPFSDRHDPIAEDPPIPEPIDEAYSPWALALSDIPEAMDDQPPTEVVGPDDPMIGFDPEASLEEEEVSLEEATAEKESPLERAVKAPTIPPPLPPPDRPAAVVVGGYRVVASIGRGGMGEIYLARSQNESSRGRLVALKVLGANAALGGDSEEALSMLMDEAAIMARIDHPNVLRVVDFGRADGRYFLATEYLQGRPLVRLMIEAYSKIGGLDYGTIAAIGADAAEGLYAAHTATSANGAPLKVVHRDVSPQNIFVTYNGTSKVIDFGVARASERVSMTAIGLVKGKAAYMSPEQAEGKEVDARSDVFSLGVCLWEMIAGKRLFKQEREYDTLLAVQLQPIEPPTTIRGNPNPVLDHIILSALHRDPARRTGSAKTLAMQLVDYAANVGVPDRQEQVVEVMRKVFGDASVREQALIDRLEAALATEDEIDQLRNLSGVTPRAGIKDVSVLGDSGQMAALDESGFPKAAALEESTGEQVIKAVEKLKAERPGSVQETVPEAKNESHKDSDPTRRLESDPSPAPTAAAIEEEDATFEPIAAGRGPTRIPVEIVEDAPVVLKPRVGLLLVAALGILTIGAGVTYWVARVEPEIPAQPLTKVAVPTSTKTASIAIARRDPPVLRSPTPVEPTEEVPDEPPPLVAPPKIEPPTPEPPAKVEPPVKEPPPKVEPPAKAAKLPPPPKAPPPEKAPPIKEDPPAKVKGPKGKGGLAELIAGVKALGLSVVESKGAYVVDDGRGGSITFGAQAKASRIQSGDADGWVIQSSVPGLTSVGWVGSVKGGSARARSLSINDCAAEVRVEDSGLALRYGGQEFVMAHGGGNLKDVNLEAPVFADRLEVEPLGLSFGKKDPAAATVHCRTGWWGRRVVLRRLPLGRYTLKWVGEGVSQTATVMVSFEGGGSNQKTKTSSTTE